MPPRTQRLGQGAIMLRSKSLAILASALLCNSYCLAQKGDDTSKSKRGATPGFDRMDRNHDDSLSEDEMPEWLKSARKSIDRNGDGKISRDEFLKSREQIAALRRNQEAKKPESGSSEKSTTSLNELFTRLDKNQDGKLTETEIPESARARIMKADTNKDGEITKQEYEAAIVRLKSDASGKGSGATGKVEKQGDRSPKNQDSESMKGAKNRKDAKPGSKPDGSPAGEKGKRKLGDFDPKVAFQRLDRNKDDKLSREELPEAARQGFDRADKDGDGFLSKQEFEAAAAAIRRLAGQGGAGGPNSPNRSPRNMFNEQDADADGRVTRKEARGTLADKFEELDTNKDGKLDVFEVENGLKSDAPKEAAPPYRKKKS